MAMSGGTGSGSTAEGLPESEEGLVRLVDRGLREVEERLCRHLEDSLRQLAQRVDADREAQGAALAEVQRELALQRDGSLAEFRRDLSTVEEAVYSKCRDLSRQLTAIHAEQAQALDQAKAVVDGAEGSLKGQLKQYIDHLRGEMEAAVASRNAEVMGSSPPRLEANDRSAELRALLGEERSLREAEAAAFLARLEALEASPAADAAAAEERMVAEEQLAALCARLETISREVTARGPAAGSAFVGMGEAEVQSMLARLEAVEVSCRDFSAGPSAGSFAALRDRFECLERQVAALSSTPKGSAAPQMLGALAGQEAAASGAPAAAEKALAAKLAALERDQGVGAATSALSCGLARCIGEFDAELRVELKEKIDGLREELRAEAQTEGKLKQMSGELEAKLKLVASDFEAKLSQAAADTEAKICQATYSVEAKISRAAIDSEAKLNQTKLDLEAKMGQKDGDAEATADLCQRVAALEGEARRTSYLITRCIGELSGSRICGSDSTAGGKDAHQSSAADTATTASTPTGVPGTSSPGSGRGAAAPHGSLSQSVKQLSDVSDEGHGWETPAQHPQRLAAEVHGVGTPSRPMARGLSASASSIGAQATPPEPPMHRRGESTSIHSLPPAGGYPRPGSSLPGTPVDTTRGSVCSSDTVPMKSATPARGLYGEARAAMDEAAQGHGPAHDEVSSSGRRRVVVVPVSATGRSVSPEMRRAARAQQQSARSTAPAMQGLGSSASTEPSSSAGGYDSLSSEERQRYLAEISSLRRENTSLREEVIDSREQALRQLRSNAERALRQQSGPANAEAEGPMVAAAAATPTVPAPAAPLRAGFQRSVSPLPPSSRVQVVPQVSSRTATPARPGMAMVSPGSPMQMEAMTSRSSASPGPRRPGAPLARVGSVGAWEAPVPEPVATARIAGPGPSPGFEARQLRR